MNLEWWVVGRVSRLLGHRPFLAYRLFALAATLALVAGVERWLRRAGVPDTHRLPALLLVFLGGGLGGLLFELTDLPALRCLDLAVAFFPFLEILANPHFAAGTALLVWALWAFCAVPGRRGVALGTILGTALGLVRPYDLALLGAIRALGDRGPGAPAPLGPGGGAAPRTSSRCSRTTSGSSSAAGSSRRSARARPSRPGATSSRPSAPPWRSRSSRCAPARTPGRATARAHLWAWAAIAGAIVAARPGAFSLQLLVGAGVPLLVLGAAGLAAIRARADRPRSPWPSAPARWWPPGSC